MRARLILAVLSACGFAALAWASFVQPAVHVVYNPSDSVPVARCNPGRIVNALADGELFLLSETNPASFDSRYFGPIQASAVIGIAQPIHLELRR